MIVATFVVPMLLTSEPLTSQTVATQSKSPGGVTIAAGSWETLATPFVDIRYPSGHKADAELYAGFIERTHRGLRTEFSAVEVDRLTRTPVPCTVWLHPAASAAISAGTALASTSYGATSVCELHFLAPSAYTDADRCCTKIGEPRDVDQIHRVLSHEYSTILLDRLTRQRAGWRFHDAPEWFEQGYEEYLGCALASDHTRTVTLAKYRDLVANAPGRIRDSDVENPYIDGTVLVHILHERFGREKVQAILRSSEATFENAFREAIGLGPLEFFGLARISLGQKQ